MQDKVDKMIKEIERDTSYSSRFKDLTQHDRFQEIISFETQQAVPCLINHLRGRLSLVPILALGELKPDAIAVEEDERGMIDVIRRKWISYGNKYYPPSTENLVGAVLKCRNSFDDSINRLRSAINNGGRSEYIEDICEGLKEIACREKDLNKRIVGNKENHEEK